MHYCDKANDVRTRVFVIAYPVDGGRMWYTWGIARICGYTPFTSIYQNEINDRQSIWSSCIYIEIYRERVFDN